MLSRIIVALIGIPILIGVLYYGGLPLLVFTNIIVGIGAYEFYQMAEIGGKKPHKLLGIILALIIPNVIFFKELNMISFGIEGIIALCTIIAISFRVIQNRVEDSSVYLGETVLGA